MAGIARLSWADLNNLAVESADTPMHQMVLATLERGPLVGPDGRIMLDALRVHVSARLERVPEMRRVLFRPGLGRGRPLWIDDAQFHIEDHVMAATLDPPGGEEAALRFAEREMSVLMDRRRPLWRLWLLEGFEAGRVGLLIKVHHALADGPAMVNILAQVFDLEPRSFDTPRCEFSPDPRPADSRLAGDSLRLKAAGLRRLMKRAAHPLAAIRSAATAVSGMTEGVRRGRGAPRWSLNRPIGATRRFAAFQVPLVEMKDVAHEHDATVNDVFLYVVGAALRRVLVARGEPVAGRAVRASVAVSLHGADLGRSGNHIGTVIVPIPLDVEVPDDLLAAVAAATARAKSQQLALASTGFMVFLSRVGVTRAYIRRQHMINVLTTNVPGPPVPLYFAGARVDGAIALPPIAGNVTASFAALSYAGNVALSAVVDGDAWPDLLRLESAMRDSWIELRSQSALSGAA